MKFHLLIIIMLLAPCALASNLVLEFTDAKTGDSLTNMVLYFEEGTTIIDGYVNDEGYAVMSLEEGRHNFIVRIDDSSTPHIDYLKRLNLEVGDPTGLELSIIPVGTIRGFVQDKYGNVLVDADLKIDCSSAPILSFPTTTDEFGSFSIDYAPTGPCRLSTVFDGTTTFEDIVVQRGSLNNLVLQLNTTAVRAPQQSNAGTWFLGLLIFVLVVSFITYTRRKEKAKQIDRATEIIPTLQGKEKAIVEYLLAKGKTVNQAHIRHELGIPRTSLTRMLQSLEQKQIICVEKHGKLVKIDLTDWFLGK